MAWFLIIYLLGCFLSYARIKASLSEAEEGFYEVVPGDIPYPWYVYVLILVYTFTSWIGFLAGVYGYFKGKEKYFLRLW